MKKRVIVSGLALPAAIALAACGSSTVQGQAVGGSSAGSGNTATGAAPGGSNPAAALSAQLSQGLTSATSAHINLNIAVGGQAITASGDETLDQGKLISLDLSESIPGAGTLQLVIVKGTGYVKLPTSLRKSSKPWALISKNSSDPTVRSLASSLASTQSSASLSSVIAFVSAARSVKQTGTGSANGGPTTSYLVDVDPSKLPTSYAGKQAIVAAGLTSIPVQIVLDSQGRPLQVNENITVQSQKVNTKITIGRYDQPVTISAPPAGQVGR